MKYTKKNRLALLVNESRQIKFPESIKKNIRLASFVINFKHTSHHGALNHIN